MLSFVKLNLKYKLKKYKKIQKNTKTKNAIFNFIKKCFLKFHSWFFKIIPIYCKSKPNSNKCLGAPKRTLGLSSHAKAMEILGKKEGVFVPVITELKCCNKKIDCGELWFLKDFKGYTARKMYIGKCDICGDDVCLQIMTSLKSKKTYTNLYTGLEAVKTIYKEKKRKLIVIPELKYNKLSGWIYGVNKEIKNKKGTTTQIRQYSVEFLSGKKTISKIIYCWKR